MNTKMEAIKDFLKNNKYEHYIATTGSIYIHIQRVTIRVADHDMVYAGSEISLNNPSLDELKMTIQKVINGELDEEIAAARREDAEAAAYWERNAKNCKSERPEFASKEIFSNFLANCPNLDELEKINRVLKSYIAAHNCKDIKYLKSLRQMLLARRNKGFK